MRTFYTFDPMLSCASRWYQFYSHLRYNRGQCPWHEMTGLSQWTHFRQTLIHRLEWELP